MFFVSIKYKFPYVCFTINYMKQNHKVSLSVFHANIIVAKPTIRIKPCTLA